MSVRSPCSYSRSPFDWSMYLDISSFNRLAFSSSCAAYFSLAVTSASRLAQVSLKLPSCFAFSFAKNSFLPFSVAFLSAFALAESSPYFFLFSSWFFSLSSPNSFFFAQFFSWKSFLCSLFFFSSSFCSAFLAFSFDSSAGAPLPPKLVSLINFLT